MNLLNWITTKQKIIVPLFFVLFFIIGSIIYKDYGLSWDEDMQWQNNGYVNYNFIAKNNKEALLNGNEKYHGPAFELLLVIIEKKFHITDDRDVYLMRHFVTFLIFFISVIFFYLLAKHIFKDWKIALLGCLLLIASPQVFAQTFYNSKDPVLLAFFIMSMYALVMFHKKQTYTLAFVYALITAITIDVRIIGILFPLITLSLVGLELVFSFFNKVKSTVNFRSVLLYLILLIPFTILFWPVLWINPVHHFVEAIKEMSYYHWNYLVRYTGKEILATDLPWHYLPVWIFISTPVYYLFLFVAGTFFLLRKIVTQPIRFLKECKNEIVVLIWFFAPLFAIILLDSIVYDAWRHVFFIYGGFILIALYGFRVIYNKVQSSKKITYLFYFISIFSITNVLYSMARIHPYQNLYFNFFAGKDMKQIKSRFELDYYGLSAREGLENLLRKDSSKVIYILSENASGELNTHILTPEQRKRLVCVIAPEDANYLIADYRWTTEGEYIFKREFYSVMVGNAKVMTVFKIPSAEQLYKEVKGKKQMSFFSDFEKHQTGWTNNRIKTPEMGAHSGIFSTFIDTVSEFSDGINITNLDALCNKNNLVLKTSFWRNDLQMGDLDAKFVICISSPDGEPYFWRNVKKIGAKNKSEIGKWVKEEAAIELPKIISVNDNISMYVWNLSKKTMYIDDMNIEFITEEY